MLTLRTMVPSIPAFLIHLGSDALFTTITFSGNFTISSTANPELNIVADVLKALANDTESFDIANVDQQRVHGGNQAIGQDIWTRLAGQFELQGSLSNT